MSLKLLYLITTFFSNFSITWTTLYLIVIMLGLLTGNFIKWLFLQSGAPSYLCSIHNKCSLTYSGITAMSSGWIDPQAPKQSACKGPPWTMLVIKIKIKKVGLYLGKSKYWIFLIWDYSWISIPGSKWKVIIGIFLYIN